MALHTMTSFSGYWSTTFGAMLIEQRGSKVTGTYGHGASAGRVEGGVRGAVLRFRYTEPGERGTGEFRLLRAGKFCGGYTAKGSRRSLPCQPGLILILGRKCQLRNLPELTKRAGSAGVVICQV